MRFALALLLMLAALPAAAQRTPEEGPAAQARFLSIIEDFATRYRAASDSATRSDLVVGRWEVLCPALPRGAFRGWQGTVEERADLLAGVVLSIRLDERVLITNRLPPQDLDAPRLSIQRPSDLFPVADALRSGQRVEIDFIPGPRVGAPRSGPACLGTLTRSQAALMEAPVFLVEFVAIRRAP